MTLTEEMIAAVKAIVDDSTELGVFVEMRRDIHCHIDKRNHLEKFLADWGVSSKEFSSENKAATRRGVGLWVLGRVEDSIQILNDTRAGKEKSYFLGVSFLDVGRTEEALEHLKEAYKTEGSDLHINLGYAEARMKTGDFDGARTMIDRLMKKHEHVADLHYLDGLWYDLQRKEEKAMEAYDRALVREPGHPRSLFRLAYIHDLRGEDAAAMEYYGQLRKLRPVHVNTMINLGVLYEDRGDYESAADCYQSILDYFPNHSRARLFNSDARAALNMFYDEEAARREQKLNSLLSQPVNEISFSPRVRNALEKLDINTTGDLVNKTEDELMTIPNFGKTSLREIREFLTSKGLQLSSGDAAVVMPVVAAGGDPTARELTEFEWSGRVQNLIKKLGLKTVGELATKRRSELLSMKNVGRTSIEEIDKRLASFGMSLQD